MLKHLTSDSYQPQEQADFEHLTQKALFHWAVANVARIHEIDFSCTMFDNDKHASALRSLRWDAKKQLLGQPDQQFHVPALSFILETEDIEF